MSDKSKKRSPSYHLDDDGKWWMTTWAEQCGEDVFIFTGACQGTAGHEGNHWTYDQNGSYRYSVPRHLITKGSDVASGMIPPGNKSYVNPMDKHKDYYGNFFETVEVVDLDLIRKLNSEDEEIDGSMTKPASETEIKWLKDNGRLDLLEDE